MHRQNQARNRCFYFGHGVWANPSDKNFKDTHKTGLGVEGGGAIGWNKTFIVGTVGYSSFGADGSNTNGSLSYVPLKAGLRQYIFSKLIYIHGDLGIATVKMMPAPGARSAEILAQA